MPYLDPASCIQGRRKAGDEHEDIQGISFPGVADPDGKAIGLIQKGNRNADLYSRTAPACRDLDAECP